MFGTLIEKVLSTLTDIHERAFRSSETLIFDRDAAITASIARLDEYFGKDKALIPGSEMEKFCENTLVSIKALITDSSSKKVMPEFETAYDELKSILLPKDVPVKSTRDSPLRDLPETLRRFKTITVTDPTSWGKAFLDNDGPVSTTILS